MYTHTHTHTHAHKKTHIHIDWNSSWCKAPYQQPALGFMIRFVADDNGSLIPHERDNRITKGEMQFFVEHRRLQPNTQHSTLLLPRASCLRVFSETLGVSLQGRAVSIYMRGITEWYPVCYLHRCSITMQCISVALYSMTLCGILSGNSFPPPPKSIYLFLAISS